MHSEAYAFVASVVDHCPPGLVVEIGGRNVNGSIRGLFNGSPYISVDVRPGEGVDVVAAGEAFQPPEPPAVVVCCEVLEHAQTAEAICQHAHAILAPGGQFIVTAAGANRLPHSAIDGGPIRDGEYYRNVWADDLAHWLAPFAEVAIKENPASGDIYAVAVKA